jgi:hypothetical protein
MERSASSLISAMAGNQPDSLVEGPFTVECILPAQFADRRTARSGEERLMLAVLEDAINCFFGDEPQTRMEATLWFRDRGSANPFSFENICAVLGFDAGWMRRELFRRRFLLKARKIAEPALLRFSHAA